ncbi:D-alanyl-D-alanine carboxypeptidase family protein [Actinotalea ferrariae]|uniref:M15 family metallopeptidase n=1 Tax=Actinotalea ferrariae TaxID=1386098 RepID=UPI001C8B4A96|nr:M15 family metallopeptidase [Actinotalea ferrariae]MBX9245145.1 D-alanyl-D-alanine carboxypeptidase family protein [Actinotalea ferrariae]
MDGVAAVSQRIGEIEGRLALLGLSRAPGGVLGGPLPTTAPATAAASTSGRSFEAALAEASTTPAPAGVGSGKALVDAKGVPVELRQYGNGTVPASALSNVEGTKHTLWTPAARSLEALRSAAAADGVTIGITDSYRTLASQVDLAERKGLYSQGGLAAKPGTSMHGWGMAVDLSLDSKAQAWMRTNAGAYGFVEDTPREPWHWGYHPTH